MDKEKWDYQYVNLIRADGAKYTVTILHYSSGDPVDRDFWRVMGMDTDYKKGPMSSQEFGFGYSLEAAIDRFLLSIEYVRKGLPTPARRPHPSEARRT